MEENNKLITSTNLSPMEQMENDLDELISTSFGRRQFLMALPLLFAACAAPQKTRYREGDNQGQKTGLSVDDEKKMTQEVLTEMKKEYPPINDEYLQNYISGLGAGIAKSNKLEGNPYNYNFTVVAVPQVNAFALPAGTVYVTAPLLAMAETEAELAGVVGHEIGHVKSRHTAERIDKQKKESGKTILFGAAGAVIGGVAGFGLGKLLCPPKDRACLAKVTAGAAAVGVGGGLLIQKYAFMANSREDEMEADRVGFRTSVSTNFHKDHVGTFYEKLLKMEQESKRGGNVITSSLADAMSTHPPSAERVNQMHQMANETPVRTNMIISSTHFEEAKKRAQIWVNANVKKS